MDRNLKLVGAGALLCLAVMVAAPAAAADWSDAQKAVWSNVEAYWTAWSKGDVATFMSYVDDGYMGWSVDTPMPASKATSNKWMSFWAANNSVAMYEITPLAILIHGDVAVVHYYYSEVSKDKGGDLHNVQGRWTDILVKKGDRWVLWADHGGSQPEDD